MSANNTVSGDFSIRAWGSSGGNPILVGSHYTSGNGASMGKIDAISTNAVSQKITFSQSIQHTHTIPDHTHTISGLSIKTKTQENATSPVPTMPPYLAVYVWKRVSDSVVNNV